MTSLFNEQETISIRRSAADRPTTNDQPSVTLDLTASHKLIENLSIYQNPLLNACGDLVALLVTLPRQGAPLDIDDFRQKLLDRIGDFKRRGLFLDYHPNVIEKSCFVLCAAFDETILYTRWGKESRWENNSLLSHIFNQRDGGEVFFHLLEQARRQPSKLVDFIELEYVLIMLGFLGKYRHVERARINEIKSELYDIIRHYRTDSTLAVPRVFDLPKLQTPWNFLSGSKLLLLGVFVILVSYSFSEFWYENRKQSTLLAFTALNMGGLVNTNKNKDLIYISTDKDLGLMQTVDEPTVDNMMMAEGLEWEVALAHFSESDDAKRLASDLTSAGYTVKLKVIGEGVELIVPNQTDLAKAKLLKNELNVRFGLNAAVRRNRQTVQ